MKPSRWMLGLLAALLVAPLGATIAQTEPSDDDAAKIQTARAATVAVFDLGRLFGDLQAMEAKFPKLALSKAQALTLLPIVKEIKAAARLTTEYAKKTIPRIQAILTTDQRKVVSGIAAQSLAGDGDGGGANRALFLSYVDGGPFNPMTNGKFAIGQDFARFYASLERRVK